MDLLPGRIALSWFDLVDILVVATAIFVVFAGWRRIKIRLVARVLLATALVYVAAQVFGLRLTISLLHGGAAVVGLSLAIVYHSEIRVALARLVQRLSRHTALPRERAPTPGDPSSADAPGPTATDIGGPAWLAGLVHAVLEMAGSRTGALIVLRGRDDLSTHLTGGSPLDAIITEPLLLSVFDSHSIGHDGAMVIEGGRAIGFQYHLPLSKSHEKLQRRGTRHAAALGLAECCDALCVVVSEERGTISIARDSQLSLLEEPNLLHAILAEYIDEIEGRGAGARVPGLWVRLRPMAASIALAMLLWFFFVHESATEYRTFVVPVHVDGLADGQRVVDLTPMSVKVILTGPRRDFYFVRPRHVGIAVRLFEIEPGEHEVTLTASDVERPDTLDFANIFPRQIRFRVVNPSSIEQ